jgi:hypothetical protein
MLTRRALRARALFLPIGATLFALSAPPAEAQRITSPKEHFGFAIGDDYRLATYTQFVEYWKKIDAETDKIRVVEIGKTAEGRPQLMAIVTAPENFARLDRYREIAGRLARAEGVSEAEARALAKEGKAVVWIDGGLHATEVLGAHQLIETVHQLATRTDEETQRILRDVIVLAVHANPDGMELVSSWYMREADSTKRNLGIPRLYQKYIGHDNNRDFYAAVQPESQNMMRVQYREWYPQIVYNHHQTGPAGTVMFAPPFRDPFNYNFDPLVPVGIDLVGAAMHSRFIGENKPGVTMRTGASYSTWWNGGLRTTVYFHNMIGLLTETIGNPTPMRIPLVPDNQLPRGDLPYPIAPQEWHFRQSVDYSLTANWAVLDVASRYREKFLYDIWRMGRNSIERGQRDHWTVTPRRVDSLKRVAAAADTASRGGAAQQGGTSPFQSRTVNARFFDVVLRDPAARDARAYVIPSDQADLPTATKFVNALWHAGIDIQRATRPFTVGGRQYPAGTFLVPAAQAFRPHLRDMFEPQDHPQDFAYPGGPPRRPYDVAGWTLAYQMGVKFDRLLEAVDAPAGTFEPVRSLATPIAGSVADVSGAAGFVWSPVTNDAVVAVNRLLKSGADVRRLNAPLTAADRSYPSGSYWVTAGNGVVQTLQRTARETGVSFAGVRSRPSAVSERLRAPRVALWDQYGGSMTSGWTRWLLEQYEYPFDVVYPKALDAGNLRAKYDVLVLPSGAVPASDRAQQGRGGGGGGDDAQRVIPSEFEHMTGRVTVANTVPKIREFLEQGGRVVAIGNSTNLGYHLGLPISNALVERSATGAERPVTGEQFYIPGSVLQVAVDSTTPVSAGMPSRVDVMYDNSPVFRLGPDAERAGVRRVAWFDTRDPLRSGWAWGQHRLEGGTAALQAPVGQGMVYLFGPEILFRAQPHGTFKWFFNALTGDGKSAVVP